MLSAQRALLGRISADVRAVTVHSSEAQAVLRVYHEGPLAEATEKEFGDAAGEMMADVPWDESPAVRVDFERSDSPSGLDLVGWPVFVRKDPPPVLRPVRWVTGQREEG